jgi:O-antigen/teichoic acid export membrane protein
MQSFSKQLLKGSAYILIATIVIRILNLFRGIIIARLFVYLNGDVGGPSYLGVVTILRELTLFIAPLLALSLPLAVAKFISEYNVKDQQMVEKVIQTSFITMTIFSIIGGVAYFVMADFLAYQVFDEPMLSWMMKLHAIFLFVNLTTMLLYEILRGFQEIKYIALLQIAVAVIEFPTIIGFTYFFNVSGFVVGSVLALFMNFIITMILVYKLLIQKSLFRNLEFDKEVFYKLINYSFPILLIIIILKPAYLIGIGILNSAHGSIAVGYYRIGWAIYNAAFFIPATIVIPLMPMISEMQSRKGDYQGKMAKLIRILIFITLPLFIFGAFAARYVIPFIYGDAYFEAHTITFFFLIASSLVGIVALVETELIGLGKTKQMLFVTASNVAIFIGLSYILIPPMGTMGFGIAFLISEFNAVALYLGYTYQSNDLNFEPLRIPLTLSIAFTLLSLFIFFQMSGIYLILSFGLLLGILVIIELGQINDDDKKILRDVKAIIKRRLGKNN